MAEPRRNPRPAGRPGRGSPERSLLQQGWRRNGLSLVLLSLFVLFWAGQFLAGRVEYNEDRAARGQPPLGVAAYAFSSHFWEATGENWESEFLQMGAYVVLTVFLYQKGSSESKDPDAPAEEPDPQAEQSQPGAPWPVRRGGWMLMLYENSLGLAFGLLFLGSAAIHTMGGARLYNEEQLARGKEAVSLLGYLLTSHFWFQSLQNWQSEFLAISSMVLLSIFLRQRGSPESKAVAAPMGATGDEE